MVFKCQKIVLLVFQQILRTYEAFVLINNMSVVGKEIMKRDKKRGEPACEY